MGKRITWNKERRDQFAMFWPCCDVPDEGWFEINDKGDLVDISDNTANCEPGGGSAEFIDTLKEESLKWDKIIAEQATYYNLTVPEFEEMMDEMAELCEREFEV